MSDERLQSEDQAILLALEMAPQAVLKLPSEQGSAAEGEDATETLSRLYLEALGMMPFALEPLTPSAGLKGRMLMTAAGDETQEVRRPVLSPPVRPATSAPAPPAWTETRPGVAETPRLAPERPAPPRPRPLPPSVDVPPAVAPAASQPYRPNAGGGPRARPSRWPFRLAATLAVAALGLSGWLGWQVEEQSGELARLRTEARQAKDRDAELVRLRQEVKSFEGSAALVSSPSVLVCPLRPALGTTAAPLGARAVLYVAADHQHWYFTARGLQESPAGQEYQIWFMAGGRPVSGGTFSMKPGEAAHVSSETMPTGTTAISITLERQGGAVIPTGPQILLGDQMQQIS